jgi:adenosylcobinamide-GDP ribazoletransferase
MGMLTAIRFLTIFPLPYRPGGADSIGKSLPYFPLVGLLLGLILLGLQYLLALILPPPVVTVLLVIALAIMTGAHHIDGLADTCDALVIGKSREERLAIMADTRTGAFGITGICLILIAKYALFSVSPTFPALLLMPALSRWAVTGAVVAFPSARPAGMGYLARRDAGLLQFIAATVIMLVMAAVLEGIAHGCILLVALALLMLGLAALFSRLFGGLTGDCFGALIETGEVISMILLIVLGSLPSFPDYFPLGLVGLR